MVKKRRVRCASVSFRDKRILRVPDLEARNGTFSIVINSSVLERAPCFNASSVTVCAECIPLLKNPRERWINLCLSYGDRISATFTEINSRVLASAVVVEERIIRPAACDDETRTGKKKRKRKRKLEKMLVPENTDHPPVTSSGWDRRKSTSRTVNSSANDPFTNRHRRHPFFL